MTSAPAANARSLPVITTAFTAASAASACARFASAASSAAESALSGGRSSVSNATPASSVMTLIPSPCWATVGEATRGRARTGSRRRRAGTPRPAPRAARPRCPARPGPTPACPQGAAATPAAASARPRPAPLASSSTSNAISHRPVMPRAEHDDTATVGGRVGAHIAPVPQRALHAGMIGELDRLHEIGRVAARRDGDEDGVVGRGPRGEPFGDPLHERRRHRDAEVAPRHALRRPRPATPRPRARTCR